MQQTSSVLASSRPLPLGTEFQFTVKDPSLAAEAASSFITSLIEDVPVALRKLVGVINQFLSDNKTDVNSIFMTSGIPMISPATRELIEEVGGTALFPVQLYELHGKVQRFETIEQRLLETQSKLESARAHILRDKIVGMLATACGVAVTAAAIFSGFVVGGTAGLALASLGAVAYMGMGAVVNKYYPLADKEMEVFGEPQGYAKWAAVLLTGVVQPAIDAFRKIPMLSNKKDKLEAQVQEQTQVVLNDFAELFDIYRNVKSELAKFDNVLDLFKQQIDGFAGLISNNLQEENSSEAHLSLMGRIAKFRSASDEIASIKQCFHEMTQI